MKKLPKEKRDKLILVLLTTLMLLALIYIGLIRPLYGSIVAIQKTTLEAQDKLLKVESLIKQRDAIQNQLFEIKDTLAVAEEDMASGDTYAWTVDTIRNFKVSYRVDIPTVGQPVTIPADLLADFPYQQLKFNISGTANFYDLGEFIAAFENKFPHIRIVNLSIEPSDGIGDDAEKLSFTMSIIALVKSNADAK